MQRSGLVPPDGGSAGASGGFESSVKTCPAALGAQGGISPGKRETKEGDVGVELVQRRSRHAIAAERRLPRHRAVLRDASGQAMVEFALVLPLLVVLMVAAIQFGIVFKDWISVTDTARVAARAAVVSRFSAQPDPCAAAQAAVAAAGGGLTLTGCTPSAKYVTVTVQHPWSVSLPLIPFSDGGQLTSVVTERRE